MRRRRAVPATPPLSCAQLQSCWRELNARYFRSALVPIRIEWSARLTSSAGLFISHTGPRSSNPRNAHRRLIRLSAPLLGCQSEREILSTLAHEMVHQWQYDVLKRRPSHGLDFLAKMDTMNDDGLGITVHHALDKQVRRFMKYEWRCQHCGRDYQRQRRTIRPRVHRCGHCRGPLKEMSRGVRQPRRRRRSPQLELPLILPR